MLAEKFHILTPRSQIFLEIDRDKYYLADNFYILTPRSQIFLDIDRDKYYLAEKFTSSLEGQKLSLKLIETIILTPRSNNNKQIFEDRYLTACFLAIRILWFI